MKRRKFISALSTVVVTAPIIGCNQQQKSSNGGETAAAGNNEPIPAFLKNYADIYAQNPRQATLEWFKNAKFGLFMHYGLYSLIGRGEWVQLRETIPLSEYTKLTNDFRADKFDPDQITDMALAAGMKYVNITSRHHDSFCLFNTAQTDYNSLKAASGRDLIKDLAAACDQKGLGLFLYYSYGLDWKHPYFYSDEASQKGEVTWDAARPNYDPLPPEYKFEKDEDFKQYIDFAHAQLKEILTQYPNLAGIWLDPIMGYYSRPDLFPIEETYALIRQLQPQALIAFKQGANGDEDFVAPERTPRAHQNGGKVAQVAWEKNQGKPIEICDTLQPKDIPGNSWGYNKAADGKHLNVDEVMKMLEHADNVNANLLLNTGPMPDGSIPPVDIETLTEVGKRLKTV